MLMRCARQCQSKKEEHQVADFTDEKFRSKCLSDWRAVPFPTFNFAYCFDRRFF